MPTASIIIATKDRLLDLAACLGAISRLHLKNAIEVCIVNDGGASIRPVVEAFPSLSIVWTDLTQSIGQVAARNRGIGMAAGDLIGFCDDDDRLLPGHLMHLATALSRSEAVWAHSDVEIVELRGVPGNWRAGRRQQFAFALADDLVRRTNPIVPASVVYRRQVHDRIGELDVSMGHYWDWDWVLRLMACSLPVESRTCSVLYGVYPDRPSQSHFPERMRSDLERLIAKHGLTDLPSMNFERMLQDVELSAYRRPSTLMWDGDLAVWNDVPKEVQRWISSN